MFIKFNLKIKTAVVLAVMGMVLSPVFCYAVNFDTGLKEAGTVSGLTENKISQAGNIPAILGDLVGMVLALLGIFFFILILYAGFIWMTAAGSGEQIEKAKKILISGAIGLVIVLSAYTITNYVFNQLLASSPGGSGNEACKNAKDGVDCGDNSLCLNYKCVTECEYQYGKTAKCGDPNNCKGTVVSGLCPGADNNKCCVPTELLEQENKPAGATQTETQLEVMEFEFCLNKGGYCVKPGDAKCGTYPGYKEIAGNFSDCYGETSSCCVSGCRAKGGMCLTTNECGGVFVKEEAESCGAGQICCVTCVSQGGNCFSSKETESCVGKILSGSKNGCGQGLSCCLGGFVK